MRELLFPLSTIEFSGKRRIQLWIPPWIVKGNRESRLSLSTWSGKIWLGSTDRFLRIDRSTKRSESSTKGLSGEEASVCVFVIGSRARSALERSRRFVRAYKFARVRNDTEIRLWIFVGRIGRRNNYSRSTKWSRKPVKLLLPPVFSFSSRRRRRRRRLFAARSVEKCHLTRE